jgi:putative SOS response-associated peptidase YedK
MCGRTALTASPEELREAFGLSEVHSAGVHYNVPPSGHLAVIRALPKARRLDPLVWGLVPAWARAEGPKTLKPVALARIETASTSPIFREAVRRRRCLVAVNGFFEWKRHEGEKVKRKGSSEPFFVRTPSGAPFALAGLWERRVSRDGEVLESCAIITQPALAPVDAIHDRMPVVLPEDTWDAWLDPDANDEAAVRQLLVPRSPELIAYPVTPRVNDPRNDDPSCLAPVERRPEQQSIF